MCGIIFVKRLDGKVAQKMLLKRYQNQKNRGTEGFGYVSLKNGMIQRYERATDEKSIMSLLDNDNSSEMFFHHRYPTSTPNFSQCAHPIKVENKMLDYDYYVIHNGVIFNDDELKVKHEALGFQYTTEIVQKWKSYGTTISVGSQFNDSEALAIELALALDKNDSKGVNVEGSVAFMALKVKKNTRQAVALYFGRNGGSPLVLDYKKNVYLSITSQGSGKALDEHTLYSFDYSTNEIDQSVFQVGKTKAVVVSTYAGYGFDCDGDDLGLPPMPRSDYLDYTDTIDEMDYNEALKLRDKLEAVLNSGEMSSIDEQERIENELLDVYDAIEKYEYDERARTR